MRLPISVPLLLLLVSLPCVLLGEPPNPALKDDLKALEGEWQRPAG